MGEFVSIRASAGVRSGADTIYGLTLPFMEGVVVASAVALCCRVSSSYAVQAPWSRCRVFTRRFRVRRFRPLSQCLEHGMESTPHRECVLRSDSPSATSGSDATAPTSCHRTSREAQSAEYCLRRFSVHSSCRLSRCPNATRLALTGIGVVVRCDYSRCRLGLRLAQFKW